MKISKPITLLILGALSGCVSNGSGFQIPTPDISRANPYAVTDSNNQVEPVFLDYVKLGTPVGPKIRLQSTPLNIGISASNSCARIVGTSWTRKGNGFNIILDVWEGAHFGYSCNKSISRLQSQVMIPSKLREGRSYAFQIIVNNKPIGIVETSIQNMSLYGQQNRTPVRRF